MNIYDLFTAPAPGPTDRQVTPYTGHDTSAYGAAALERECQAVHLAAPGTRNHTLNRAAYNLAQLVASGHLEADLVRSKLANAAVAAGLGPREIEATLASGARAGALTPRAVQPLEPLAALHVLAPPNGHAHAPQGAAGPGGDNHPGAAGQGAHEADTDARDPTPAEALAAWVTQALPVVDWEALWAADEDDEWILEPLIPARRMIALYSPPKVGKSLLMLELAAAIAAGRPVLGQTPERPRRVLYVDFENDPRGDVRPRLQAMGYAPADLKNLAYLSFPTLSALDTERGAQELMAAVTVYEAELVVIDTLSRAVAGEENENDTWLKFYRSTGVRLKAAGVACVRLDHTGKDVTKGQRGGSAKSGDADAIWRMDRINDVTFTLRCEAHRLPVPETYLTFVRRPLPHLHSALDGTGRSAAFEKKVASVVEVLDAADLPLDAGRRQAARVVAATGLGLDRNRAVLDAAIERRRAAGGVYTFEHFQDRD